MIRIERIRFYPHDQAAWLESYSIKARLQRFFGVVLAIHDTVKGCG